MRKGKLFTPISVEVLTVFVRLATERLSEAEIKATLNEKEARKLRIKERKDRKRRLARAGGGRQSGDMRVMTVENWKNEGDLWRGKVSCSSCASVVADDIYAVLAIDSKSTSYPADIHPSYTSITYEARFQGFRHH
jgi:hypothetical protein